MGACATLGRRVKVVGEGRGLEAARAAAGPGAEFLGFLEDAEVDALLSGARGLLFPGEEDFGIVPVEAQAAGVPVIAYGAGGVRDTVIENETGVFHAEQTVTSVASAILQAESMRFRRVPVEGERPALRSGALPRRDDRCAARARPGGGAQVSATPDLRFEPERERDSVAYALGVLRRRWLVVVAAVVACLVAGFVITGRGLRRPLREQRARAVRHLGAVGRRAAGRPLRARSRARGRHERAAGRLGGGRRRACAASSACRPRVDDLLDKVEVEAEQNANVLQITATRRGPAPGGRAGQRLRERVRRVPRPRRPPEHRGRRSSDLQEQLAQLPVDAPERQDLRDALSAARVAARALANGDARVIARAEVADRPVQPRAGSGARAGRHHRARARAGRPRWSSSRWTSASPTWPASSASTGCARWRWCPRRPSGARGCAPAPATSSRSGSCARRWTSRA